MNKQIRVSVIERTKDSDWDTLNNEGQEAKSTVIYNIVLDPKTNMWVGGRADGKGPTFKLFALDDMLELISNFVFEEVSNG